MTVPTHTEQQLQQEKTHQSVKCRFSTGELSLCVLHSNCLSTDSNRLELSSYLNLLSFHKTEGFQKSIYFTPWNTSYSNKIYHSLAANLGQKGTQFWNEGAEEIGGILFQGFCQRCHHLPLPTKLDT